MRLQSIEPEFREWIFSINEDNIYDNFVVLENDFNEIITDLMYGNISDNILIKDTNRIRKLFLYFEIIKNTLLNNKKIYKRDELEKKIKHIKNNFSLIDAYEVRNGILEQKKTIDILTTISMICLPLGIIVGYFGMNFKSMGNPITNENGILAFKHGQTLVFFLFFISIIIILKIIRNI